MTELEYNSTIEAIFNRFPSFQKVGGAAYKPGITNMYEIDEALGEPSKKIRAIHIAGTNGKGSVSHFLAAALMQYKSLSFRALKVGLYTSPHLVDFRERIKINGEMVPREWVYNFLVTNRELFERQEASFFEITTAMAFSYFAENQVDIAVIECGLGGRLDSTNILEKPLLSVITNIGLDHCQYLGNTLEEIALEKCGIIKRGVPLIVGERSGVAQVFENEALRAGSSIAFAEDLDKYRPLPALASCIYAAVDFSKMDLKGAYQAKNIKTASLALASVIGSLSNLSQQNLSEKVLYDMVLGLERAATITGLRGRWEKLSDNPLIICDIGHNPHGLKESMPQVKEVAAGRTGGKLYIIFGVMRDKDLEAELPFLPKEAYYYFVNTSGSRALPALQLAAKMVPNGFWGEVIPAPALQSSAIEAFNIARKKAKPQDFIFIGGSSYVVADILRCKGI